VRTQGGARLRLCALPVSRQAAERERAKLRESARKNGRQVSQRSLRLADYIVVVTSLPLKRFALRAVFDLFRMRWQIELAFKRFKSLLNAGHVPKTDPDSVQAWLQAKLLTSLLIEKLLLEAEVFSPWGFVLVE
jgi:IS4 transposase